MSLKLTITSHQRQAFGAAAVKVIYGGTAIIGRAADTDWVLADANQTVSRKHARIDKVGGDFVLTDTSVNGTFVNDSPEPIGNGRSYRLVPGDRLLIGDFVIAVAIEPTQAAAAPPPLFNPVDTSYQNPPPSPGPVYQPPPWDPAPPPPPQDRYGPIPGADAPAGRPEASGPWRQPYPTEPGETVDPLEILGAPQAGYDPYASGRHPAPLPPVDRPAPQNEHYTPPTPAHVGTEWRPDRPSASGEPRPRDHTEWRPDGREGSGVPAPQRDPYPPQPRPVSPVVQGPPVPAQPYPQAPSLPAGDPLERLLVAAGLDPAMARAALRDPRLAETLGAVLHLLVAGMLEVLRARAKIKNDFRLTHTQISADHNNPLKLSPNAQAALQSLFVEPQRGFLPPLEAVGEGFDDIKSHQFAMLAGMRAAFDYMFRQFDPAALQERFERKGKGAGILGNTKAYYWEQLVDLYGDLKDDPERSYQRLFGEEFAKAYEQQMQRLAGARRR